ncbi:MAG TPA: glycosyltransferase family 2 protein [Actinomycetota bacterium]|jgi:glycosyltransferase involved in cell wall biosynthesis|nr:glycosyltransferase family 2 protein [Actinomycetota bacterium]
MWHDRKVSVVLPTYNEKDSIREAIGELWSTGVVDEVIVVDNNAAPGTREQVDGTGARLVEEKRQGYGWSCRRGLAEAVGDIVILSEPDGTFIGRDVFKLLAYSDDFDFVLGSRTAKELIWSGANMGWFLRWGNWAVAKMMEFLYNTSNLTDVGCTMRLIHRKALDEISPHFTIGRNHFSPEMMVLSILAGHKLVQIPVNYRERVGESSATGDFWKAFKIGVAMIATILSYRFGPRRNPFAPRTPQGG